MTQYIPINALRALLIVIASVAAVCTTAWADPVIPMEDGYEASTNTITLPSSNAGIVVRKDCNKCQWPAFNVNSQTKFFIGNHAVSLSELIAHARKDGPHFVMLFTKVDRPDLTRIVISESSKRRASAR